MAIGALLLPLCMMSCGGNASYKLENDFLSRTITVKDGVLATTGLVNKLNGNAKLEPSASDEFALRLSQGTDKTGTDFILTAKDFAFVSADQSDNKLAVKLENKEHGLKVTVRYELDEGDKVMRKHLDIEASKPVTLERIDVESIALEDAFQPYKRNEMTSKSKDGLGWRPNLGQPLYTLESATFWGVEFPAATNTVNEQKMSLGYLWGRELEPGKTYSTYKAIVGVADDRDFIDDCFYEYIDGIRIRPLRLQVQYNSWFDFGGGVSKDNFKKSADKVHHELVTKRNCKPLSAYVIDDGWQGSRSRKPDWKKNKITKVWSINEKFSPDFKDSHKLMDSLNSQLGLWLSPGCFFGARPMVKKLGEQGFESLNLSMSLAGPKYMKMLEERILELTKQGVSYFKFDGTFGHLYIRDFELNGRGAPAMPQLGISDWKANDPRLNDSKYDELKTYYMVAGTERLIEILQKQHEINPRVFNAITNGAYLSPWWMMHTDVVWMINAGDAAGGSDRTGELVYRDGVYYDIWERENAKFPMSALFNHEPKKTKTGESADTFRRYLYMNLSRGTGFVELYLKTQNLSDQDWTVLAEGLHWSYDVFPAFKYVKMHGGNPKGKDVYGYTGWNAEQGFVSLHNPSDKVKKYTFTLNRKNGVRQGNKAYMLSSPISGDTRDLKEAYKLGESFTLELQPKEIRILNFSHKKKDWSKIKSMSEPV
ncbi:enterotoxin [Fulvitalea axinellae]|uniref:Enterotoxin n=2 Tax=Fulvitalea axinellae TaxID=1182444 RepID=A0AAU9CTP0_9BACT|nr:enterotoxin [Fulvitalea axinellae]